MKFGRNLPRNVVPEWSASYISYKALKKLIRSVAEKSGSSFDAFATSDLEDIANFWETRLVAIIQEKYKKKGSDEVPLISFDIYTAIKSQSDKITAA
jgi:glycerophosphodiester phosphodiesterase